MNFTRQNSTSPTESGKPAASTVMRLAGLAAAAAGLIFAGIQPIHPPDYLESVNTGTWAVIMPLKTVMSFLFLVGLAGLYARQATRVGWVGLVGVALLCVSWSIHMALIFAEAFILPLLATESPEFVEGFLTLVNGEATNVDIGALPLLYGVNGVCYMLGGLLFGIATFRAGILPRSAAGLLAVTAAVTPAAALLPHELQRLVGMPVGIAIAWLGFALWSEYRRGAAEESQVVLGQPIQASGVE